MQKLYSAQTLAETVVFYNVIRHIAYWQLGLNTRPTESMLNKFFVSVAAVFRMQNEQKAEVLRGPITVVSCRLWGKKFDCRQIGV